jgi:hypothetical protein
MNAEEMLLQVGPVTVTTVRFIVRRQTFVIRNITSVEFVYHPVARSGPIALILMGMIAALLFSNNPESQFGIVIGVLLAAAGVVMFIFKRTIYEINLVTSGGQLKALSSTGKDFVAMVADALNRAIVARTLNEGAAPAHPHELRSAKITQARESWPQFSSAH